MLDNDSDQGGRGGREQTVGKLTTHDVLKTTHLMKTTPIFTFSLTVQQYLSNGAYFAFLYRATEFCSNGALMQT